MKLFEMKNWTLSVSEEAWGLSPFKKILERDTSKDKSQALAEMLFIWFWADIKSDYIIMDYDTRFKELKADIPNLPKNFKIDKVIQEGIDCYNKHKTVIESLFEKSLSSAIEVGNYLENTKALLAERDGRGVPVTKIADITRGLKDIKFIIKDLKDTEKQVIKERQDSEGKEKGSQKMNMFEDGL